MSFWKRLKKGLEKTSAGLERALGFSRLDSDSLEALEESLIMTDMGVKTATNLVVQVEKAKVQTSEEAKEVLAKNLETLLETVAVPFKIDTTKKPFVILMVGVNGTGKTTTIGKLAMKMKADGLKVAFGAADTFRMAAIEQLKEWGKRTDCPVYAKQIGSDAAGVAYDAFEQAKKEEMDVLFLDTAGRLQNKKELMAELQKIARVLKKLDDTAPHAVLLSLDATVGQNALQQVAVFKEMMDVSGIVMTKLDGTAKGGILVALAQQFGLPIYFIGVGEQPEDLDVFEPTSYVHSLLSLKNEKNA